MKMCNNYNGNLLRKEIIEITIKLETVLSVV